MVGFARSACGDCNALGTSCRPCKGTADLGDTEQCPSAKDAELFGSVEELVFVKTGRTNKRKQLSYYKAHCKREVGFFSLIRA